MSETLDKLRAHVEGEAGSLPSGGLESYKGSDWWQLSEEESAVFELPLESMPLLVTAFDVYLAIKDVAENDFHDTPLCIAARQDLNVPGDQKPADLEWMKFASLFGISHREAYGFYYKNEFHLVRNGTRWFGDEK